ncbi:MAG: DUF599 domain-containing protein [Marinibacterium sp.]|nr:DUF599 domain-containing protein [Marinibacterium sp.]
MPDLILLVTFSLPDYLAVGLLFAAWGVLGWRIEHPPRSAPSTAVLMSENLRLWMQEMARRENRIFDAQVVASLRQGTAFFGSATMLAIGGALALLGNTDQLSKLSGNLQLGEIPDVVWETKLLLVVIFLVNSFLKYVWSHRLFGYCSILMGTVPDRSENGLSALRAEQAATLGINAVRGFNRGLRATYFAMAATAWLIGPLALVLATAVTVAVLWRREFASGSRATLLQSEQTGA